MTFREIRGVQPGAGGARKRWFQDPYFDLFLTEKPAGRLLWFQLCYRRDTPFERVLEWRRGAGFQHHKVRLPRHAGDAEEGVLAPDGRLPYEEVSDRFRAAGGLPEDIAGFVTEKMRQYSRPDRRFRPKGARTPAWLTRLRAKL